MPSVREQLHNILKGVNTCVLCLRKVNEDAVNVKDEIILENKQNITIYEIITFVMGSELQESGIIEVACSVCRECTISAIKCYTFMTVCQKSHSELQNLVNNLSIIDFDALDETCFAKTLYITFPDENLDIKLILDKKRGAKTRKKTSKRNGSIISKIENIKIKNKSIVLEEVPIHFDSDIGSPEIADIDNKKKFTCKECLKVFNQSRTLKCHLIRVHAPKTFQCTECPKKFGSDYLRKLHLTESHTTAMCTDCGKIYSNIHSWKMHMGSHKTKICPTCGKQYKDRVSYSRHLKLQACGPNATLIDRIRSTYDYKYHCDICKKRFTHKSALRAHIQFEHENGKSYSCNWCEKKFSAKSKLKQHIVKHTRERNFTCEICGGKFVTREALIYHTRIHTGEKPYPCSECDERFISASRRMEHLRRKHWAPNFECNVCSSKFKYAYCLKKHKQRHFNPNSRLFAQKSIEGVEV